MIEVVLFHVYIFRGGGLLDDLILLLLYFGGSSILLLVLLIECARGTCLGKLMLI